MSATARAAALLCEPVDVDLVELGDLASRWARQQGRRARVYLSRVHDGGTTFYAARAVAGDAAIMTTGNAADSALVALATRLAGETRTPGPQRVVDAITDELTARRIPYEPRILDAIEAAVSAALGGR